MTKGSGVRWRPPSRTLAGTSQCAGASQQEAVPGAGGHRLFPDYCVHRTGEWAGGKGVVVVDGCLVHGVGEADVWLMVDSQQLEVACLVMANLVDEFKVIVGMDVIRQLGGATVDSAGVWFGRRSVGAAVVVAPSVETRLAAVEISNKDFEARFDRTKWTVAWRWRDVAPVLTNMVSKYAMSTAVEQQFDEELEKWKEEGWLQPCEAPTHGVIPLLAVEQECKGKVRPVMDFRELNAYVESHTGDSDVCGETLCKWRSMKGKPAVLDLRSAYLQLHVHKELQRFQIMKHRGHYFQLMRLSFGLNCAPKIMTAVLAKVLSLDAEIDAATDHYIDDIIVNSSLVSVARVAAHLQRYGLQTKPPERIEDACVLGLQVCGVAGQGLLWSPRQ